ncbi:glycosyltransferase family 4 protein [uncultured Desulfobacter sp.]|uniref:glycosyltransferase family 4 protein n=1 Tax=uncultured Desulfobacter sp. TaxID=240139 RepID=UPI0029F5B609|nr:glycosyltransferase family 4 protein [uncultured Desulfobacter sp.]
MTEILVLTSTWPYLEQHHHPRFVNLLCRRLEKYHKLIVVAPSIRGEKPGEGEKASLFRYCFAPFELLTGGDGISTNLKRKPWLYFVIPFYFAGLIIHCRGLIQKKDIGVIHAHWIFPQGLAAALCRVMFRFEIPLLITAHGGDLYGYSGRILSWVKKWVLNRADHITVVSRAMETYCVEKLGCSSKKLSVCSMGVDLQNIFVPGNYRRDPYKIVYIGRLVEKKGVDVLIRAMAKVLDQVPGVQLDVIGGGSDLGLYKSLAESLGLSEAIQFLGAIPNHEVPRHFQRVGLAVMPFRVARGGDQEGLGLTMVEAIGCGCTVIASDLPGVQDVIEDGKTGFLVPSENPQALAEKIIQVIRAADRRDELCPKARELILDKFDWDRVAKTYAELLHKLKGGAYRYSGPNN